jgi:hypothetical protein
MYELFAPQKNLTRFISLKNRFNVMIARYYAKCDSCGSVTMLRLAIGHDENQKFKYECENCNREIIGSLELNQEKGNIKKLNLNGAKGIDTNHHDYVFTTHPFFLNRSSKREFSSPFIDAASRNIDDFPKKIMKSALLKRMAENDVKTLKKIYKNYKQKKWNHFSTSVKEFLPDWPLEKQIDRNRALYQILEYCVFPVVTSEKHIAIIDFLNDFLIDLRKKNDTQFMNFVKFLDERKILSDIQDKSFKFTFRFFELEKDIRPIMVDWDPNNPDKELPRDLKIMGETPFDKIKSFYVDGFEWTCDALTIIQGLINLKYRSDYNLFPEHPTINKGKPFEKTMEAFVRQQSNAPKMGILYEEKNIENWIISALDPVLRNAIGHGDVEFDEVTELVKYPINKEKTQFVTMSYAEFLLKCIRLFTVIHQINHLVKMLNVHLYFPTKQSPSTD